MTTVTEYLDRELLAFGQRFHGHKCPAMPMGLRAGLAALRALGVERAPDKQLMAKRSSVPGCLMDALRLSPSSRNVFTIWTAMRPS